jgi:hypothetical protein
MATIKGKFITGTSGGNVYKRYRNTQVVTALPHFFPEKMTVPTKNAAATFGKASKLAGWIRRCLTGVITPNYDGTAIYRLNTEVLSCLNRSKNATDQTYDYAPDSFDSLPGFDFNVHSPMRYQFLAKPVIDITETQLLVTFPQMNAPEQLRFPKDIKNCKILINTVMVDLQNGRIRSCTPQSLDVGYTFPSSLIPAHTFEFDIMPGVLCIVGFSLQYFEDTFAGNFYVNSKSFNPSAILYSWIAPGELAAGITDKFSSIW